MPVKETTEAESLPGRSTARTKALAAACSSPITFSCEAEVSTSSASETGSPVSRSKRETCCSTPSSRTRTSSGRSVVTKRPFASFAVKRRFVASDSMRSTASPSAGVGVGDGVDVGVGVCVGVCCAAGR